MSRLFVIFGASDPEAAAAKKMLDAIGIQYANATVDSVPVHGGNAYRANGTDSPLSDDSVIVLFECDLPGLLLNGRDVIRVDHHRPGDPGYGRPPAEFMGASSIGQLVSLLAERGLMSGDVPQDVVFAAAADHCLAEAYAGQCPGVDPDELMRWRINSRAKFQGRSAEEILADVERARKVLREAVAETDHPVLSVYCPQCDADHPDCYTGGRVSPPYADLRGRQIPELPEAAAREGIPFLASVKDRDGREKVVLQVASPDLVQDFLDGNIVPGLTDTYGDPARGFAGGYVR